MSHVLEMDTMDNLTELLALAKQNHTAGNLAQAEALYRQFLQSTRHAWYLLGAVCHAQGKFAEAEEYLRLSLRFRPDFAECHYHLGMTLAELGKPAQAEECFRQALKLKPDLASALRDESQSRIRPPLHQGEQQPHAIDRC